MEQELPKPLVSDEQLKAMCLDVNVMDTMIKAKVRVDHGAWGIALGGSLVRDFYEAELQRLRAQVEAMRVAIAEGLSIHLRDNPEEANDPSAFAINAQSLLDAASLNPTPTTEPK